MGSEMQPGVMRAQKRETQISFVKKFTFSSFYMELEVYFTIIQQTYSKTLFKLSFMNRKSSCGYALHFF
jgi:hypothetical protein